MLVSVKEIRGGNLDIDLIPKPGLDWEVGRCPWNEAEPSSTHRCAVKETSTCPYSRASGPSTSCSAPVPGGA